MLYRAMLDAGGESMPQGSGIIRDPFSHHLIEREWVSSTSWWWCESSVNLDLCLCTPRHLGGLSPLYTQIARRYSSPGETPFVQGLTPDDSKPSHPLLKMRLEMRRAQHGMVTLTYAFLLQSLD